MLLNSHGSEVARVSIERNGDPLRETAVGSQKLVHVPDGAEYGIMIKNLNYSQILADVWMDGIKLTSENQLLLDGYQTLHLERFLDTDRKFKFVRYEGSGQENSVEERNAGIIRVRIWHNVGYRPKPFITQPTMWWQNYSYPSMFANPAPYSQQCRSSFNMEIGNQSVMCCSDANLVSRSIGEEEIGTTVEGSKSDQSFHEVTTTQRFPYWEEIIFKLVVADEPTAVAHNSKFCPKCGTRNKNYSYCPECGQKL